MRLIHTSLFLASALVLSACKQDAEPAATPADTATPAPAPAADPAAPPPMAPAAAAVATAELQPTKDSTVKGSIRFTVVDGRLHASGDISGLKPGSEHGFHIHEKGDCSAPDGSSAGGHFNPGNAEHGSIDAPAHHGGDMPNIVADAQGNAHVDGPVSSNVNAGKGDGFDIIGRGLIVHADPDDYHSQPTGNAGARLACAVIAKAQ
ncbi:superoxide dismutase family protein [Stenotrophomonas acidaminiphila]|uniref:superoxide dismutase family protein n=1 Tax=Stenotrophomonas TaxID=40323 RepID=UPI001376287F|nr:MULTISPECIES: superoxide dismutase family protein [Stenotrophomonas]MCH1909952.1 superoxide dismutase family protein [Stenotrophomonas sp. Y6]MPS36989.1 superoxide dismutase family protein [Stenotrophomonas sp.]NCT88252.1 superoxide dismutase family protein [Stenotrophomonas acidaminiphila]